MSNDDIEIGVDVSRGVRALETLTNYFGKLDARANGAVKGLGATEKSLAGLATKLGGFNTQGKSTTNAFESMKTAADDYRRTLDRLSNVEGATKLANGSYQGKNGKFLRADDVKEYEAALRGLNAIEAQRVVLLTKQNAEQSKLGTMKPASPIGSANLSASRANSALDSVIGGGTSVNLGDSMKLATVSGKAVEESISNVQRLKTAFNEASNSTRYLMYDVSNSLAIGAAAVGAFGIGAAAAAIKFEASFAAVRRTVGGTEESLNALSAGLVKMSQNMPVAFTDLTEIAALAGQLGISGVGGVTAFTETVAKLTATTNLSSEAAGTALGRFASFFAENKGGNKDLEVNTTTFGNLASSILKVGVNSVATETSIVNVGTQISSMGSYAGLTADQVVGLAGALSSVGVPPELSRGVVTRLFSEMGEAVAMGGSTLNEYARISGLSAEQFQKSWGSEDFANTFIRFMQGIRSEGSEAITTLHGLGITSVRDVPVLMRLAGAANAAGEAGGLLAQTMADARSGWTDNTELALQYNAVASTTGARLQVLGQNFEALFASMGNATNGPLKELINLIIDIVKGLTDVISTPAGQFFSAMAIGTTVLTGAVLLLTAGLARGVAMVVGFKQALDQAGASALTAGAATRIFNVALIASGIGAAIAVLGAISATIVGLGTSAANATGPISDTAGLLSAMKKDTEDGGRAFGTFSANVAQTGNESEKLKGKATRLSAVLEGTGHAGQFAGKGLGEAAENADEASLTFGRAAQEFVKGQLAIDSAFQETASDNSFADYFTRIGASTDKAIQIAADKGKEGVRQYFLGLEREYAERNANFKILDGELQTLDGSKIIGGVNGMDGASGSVNKYIDAVGGVDTAAQRAANSQRILEGATVDFSNAANFATLDSEALGEAVGDDLVKDVAKGVAAFTNQGDLIGRTQDMLKQKATETADNYKKAQEHNNRTIDEGRASWESYYDGVSFALGDYLTQMHAAADEQTKFTENLSTLGTRSGVTQGLLQELAELGPKAAPLVQALVDGTDEQLGEYVELWGQTGTSSAEKYAANLLSAQMVLQNAAASLGGNVTSVFLDEVEAGRQPLTEILAKYGLDAAGNPIKIKGDNQDVKDKANDAMSYIRTRPPAELLIRPTPYQSLIESINGIVASVQRNMPTVTIPTKVAPGPRQVGDRPGEFATGGYTGAGAKYQPAGIVHAGEFVMTKEATNRIGVGNLYAMMNNSKNARGYAGGGVVAQAAPVGQTGFATLDAQSLQAIMALSDRPIYLYTSDRVLAESVSRGAQQQTLMGSN